MKEEKTDFVLRRKIEHDIKAFFASKDAKCLLISGARQTGKTYIIEKLGRENFKHFVKVDFIASSRACEIFASAKSPEDIIQRLPLLTDRNIEKGKTLFFFDEVQKCNECVTAVKYLVQEGSYKYILSGSLLGVELNCVKSIPVGYMNSIDMFPLDFEEFCIAVGTQESIISSLKESFDNEKPVDESVHKFMLSLFRLYLVVGGMPGTIVKYLSSNNLHDVVIEEANIIKRYKEDITKYEVEDKKLRITRIFDAIPGELNNINKRFVLSNLGRNEKADRYENSFEWLKKAGVAIAVYNAKEPLLPLKLSETSTLFKLFMCDVGLLASMYMDDIQLRVLNGEENINFGAVYENYVAQELRAHGYEDIYYFNSRKQGEVDFLIPYHNRVLPIEVKSGRSYMTHAALDRILNNPKYALEEAFVLSEANIERRGRILYLPIYMTMFIKKPTIAEDMVYKIDFSILGEKGST